MNIVTRLLVKISPWYNEEEAARREQRTQLAANQAKQTVFEARTLLDNYKRSSDLFNSRSA